MKHYSAKAEQFIQENVLPQLKYDTISEENIGEIVDFLTDHYEVPLAQAKEAGESIDNDLLSLVSDIVSEITSDPNW